MDSTTLRPKGYWRESSRLQPIRRIVTGHDKKNRAIILSDGPPSRVQTLSDNGPTFHEIWSTRETPARIDRDGGEPHEDGLTLTPPAGGTRIRILDLLPEGRDGHALMQRTESIDYGIVLHGESTLIVDEGETIVRAGDIVIQRGTNHAWANRSGRLCRIAFILVDGKFDEELHFP